ncbi:hypothetical protein RND71_030098 [Anisodus tanguticus]|uniref:protein-serine/threonine phosphatase n=1 Tax=Anisodus tanguticus TaxID=243964 RepID=A0AAE1V7V1_9SOLA|nr:hypothetical protein RND71_030098 [Anisodus tanguticus]
MADAPAAPVPVVGAISTPGRERPMEDAISVRPHLYSPYINRNLPIDFFAVYDGHGGPHAAGLLRDRMHLILIDELMMVRISLDLTSGSSSSGTESSIARRERLEAQRIKEAWKRVLRRCFQRIDEMALVTCSECGIGVPCGCPPVTLGMSGSTAVLVILTADSIIAANCGDSRAVLSRGGRALPLSNDHKLSAQLPDRIDERSRIEALGGRVEFGDRARVQGILSMSRAIGDKYLKPYISAEPELSIIKRIPEDEFLILASDGLWDVVSSETACHVARMCLRGEDPAGNHNFMPWVEGADGGAIFSSRSAVAAALLTRLAVGRKSLDNIKCPQAII